MSVFGERADVIKTCLATSSFNIITSNEKAYFSADQGKVIVRLFTPVHHLEPTKNFSVTVTGVAFDQKRAASLRARHP